MKLVQTRTAAGCKIYDLMYRKESGNHTTQAEKGI